MEALILKRNHNIYGKLVPHPHDLDLIWELLRNMVSKEKDICEWLQNPYHTTLGTNACQLEKQGDNVSIIDLYAEDEDNSLRLTLPVAQLIKILDLWERCGQITPQYIVISAAQDTYSLECCNELPAQV
jgi:hypothetical protein